MDNKEFSGKCTRIIYVHHIEDIPWCEKGGWLCRPMSKSTFSISRCGDINCLTTCEQLPIPSTWGWRKNFTSFPAKG